MVRATSLLVLLLAVAACGQATSRTQSSPATHDRQRAGAMLIRLDDGLSGWSRVPSPPNRATGCSIGPAAKLEPTADVPGNIFESADGGSHIITGASLYRTTADARLVFAALSSRSNITCVMRALVKTLPATVGAGLTIEHRAMPAHGDQEWVWRMRAPYRSAYGDSVLADLVVFRQGRAIASDEFTSRAGALPMAWENRLLGRIELRGLEVSYG